MALALRLDVLTRDAPADAPLVLEVRSLTVDDLREHAARGAIEPQRMTERMRTIHHSIARMEAAGLKHVDISRLTGYSQVTLSVLQRNPAYQELVAHYCEKADRAAFDLTERMFFLGLDTIDRLHEKVLDREYPIPVKDLRGIITDMADRTGHAPVQRSERLHLHVGLTKEEIEEAKNASKRGNGSVKDSAPARGTLSEAPAADPGPGLGGGGGSGAVLLLSPSAGEGGQARGASL
jgi:hypothetical protein